MNLVQLYNKLCCVSQWSIGFSEGNIQEIIRDKNCSLTFKWLPLTDNFTSIADPFIFRGLKGELNLLYEDFSMVDDKKYGKIYLASLDKDFTITDTKKVLDTTSHSSYPFIFFENGITYIIPETSAKRKVSAFEYDYASKSLINEKVLIDNLPLLDSTVFKHNGKYWLFATLAENGFDHSRLYIYYADNLFGNYTPHKHNPVKNSLDGTRPAGNVIFVNGDIYRPTQNCNQHYGESISISKIVSLSENEFSEDFYFKISPQKRSLFNAGVHTINVIDNVIVIDGIKMLFKPLTKWKLYLKKKFKNKAS